MTSRGACLVFSVLVSLACRSPKPVAAEADASLPRVLPVDAAREAAAKTKEPTEDARPPLPHAPIPNDASPQTILDLWTTAMGEHDLSLLQALYADNVVWTPKDDERTKSTSSATELLVRHSREFAKATPESGALSTIHARFFPDGSDGTYIEFTKVLNVKGRETSHQASLFVEEGRILAEADEGQSPTVRWNWCVHSIPATNADYLGVPRARGMGAFTVTPTEAIEFVMESKHLADLKAKTHAERLKAVLVGCPQPCENADPRGPHAAPACVDTRGAYEIAVRQTGGPGGGDTVEEVEVDAMSAHGLKWKAK